MKSFARRGKGILIFAALFLTLSGAAVSAQEMAKLGIAAYVSGGLPANEKKVLGAYLIAAILKADNSVIANNSEAFLAAAMADEQAKGGANLSIARVCELGKQFNIRFVCITAVTSAFEFFLVQTRIVDTETEEVLFKGEAQSPLKTIEDLTQTSNKIVESMFGVSIPDTQTAAQPAQARSAESAGGASTATVSVTGDAKAVVDRVVAAVNAFKDATTKSIDAANAVKTAMQSKNFSAIKEAKKKVESATEAVKKAKEDVTAAIEALNSAGPEATAAVKAMGIDLSMFGGKAGGAATDGADQNGSSDIENFTVGERLGTAFMNQVVPGLGSGVIMHDGVGLGMQIALSALGYGLISVGAAVNDPEDRRDLMVFGGIALGTNVIYNIVRSATYRKPGSRIPPRSPRRFDYYFSPKYQTPVGTPVSWGGINAETGLVWEDGAFFGLDFSYGSSDDKYNHDQQSGIGLSLGNVYNLVDELQFVYGMSAGCWYVNEHQNDLDWYWGRPTNESYNFLAPFVKLRYNVIEITYRGLLGISHDGFGWNSHQLMLGFYFATNKRPRQ